MIKKIIFILFSLLIKKLRIMISPKFGKKVGEFFNSLRGLMAIVQTAVMIEYYFTRE